jgi:hypothetical protein
MYVCISKGMENYTSINDKFNTLPPRDDFATFVTRAEFEDALQGIRKNLESKLPSPDDFAQFMTWAGSSIHF